MSTPNPASLDDAQAAILEILGAAVEAETTSVAGYLIDDVYDGGQGRHERLVSFSLTTVAGVSTTFTATIRGED
jgi:hypothetical protein